MDFKINSYEIEEVLPHEHPMILLDSLDKYNSNSAYSSVTITNNSNFFDTQLLSVPNYVGIEYMAQGIAAYANAHERDSGAPTAIGFLVSSRKFKMFVPDYALGSKLSVFVEKLYQEDNGLSAFDCNIQCNGKLLAQAKINVFQPEDPIAFLKESI